MVLTCIGIGLALAAYFGKHSCFKHYSRYSSFHFLHTFCLNLTQVTHLVLLFLLLLKVFESEKLSLQQASSPTKLMASQQKRWGRQFREGERGAAGKGNFEPSLARERKRETSRRNEWPSSPSSFSSSSQETCERRSKHIKLAVYEKKYCLFFPFSFQMQRDFFFFLSPFATFSPVVRSLLSLICAEKSPPRLAVVVAE